MSFCQSWILLVYLWWVPRVTDFKSLALPRPQDSKHLTVANPKHSWFRCLLLVILYLLFLDINTIRDVIAIPSLMVLISKNSRYQYHQGWDSYHILIWKKYKIYTYPLQSNGYTKHCLAQPTWWDSREATLFHSAHQSNLPLWKSLSLGKWKKESQV